MKELTNIKTLQKFGISDYCVTSDGTVHRLIEGDTLTLSKPLKTYICNGHSCIKIRRMKFYIDVLVASLFLGERPEGMQVFHKNKNKRDNRVENLIYLTPSQVQLYSTYTKEYLEEMFE